MLCAILSGCGDRAVSTWPGDMTADVAGAVVDADSADSQRILAIEAFRGGIPAPPLGGPARQAEVDAWIPLLGSQAEMQSPLAVVDMAAGTAFLQTANGNQDLLLCWAMYHFEGLGEAAFPALVRTDLEDELPSSYFIGVSDYAKDSWQWTEIATPLSQNSVAVGGPHAISSSGDLYVVVATFGGESLTLGQVTLRGDIALPPPEYFSASTNKADGIWLSWKDPADSFDPDGPGPQQFAFSQIGILVSASIQGPWKIAATLPAGTTSYWYGYGPSYESIYGNPLYFRASCMLASDWGPPGNAARGIRQLGPPTNLVASRGDFLDRVELSWNTVPGAVWFEVYARRQDTFELLPQKIAQLQVPRCTFDHTWDHGCAERGIYEYFVRAVDGAGRLSPFSEAASGWIHIPDIRNVVATHGLFEDQIVVTWDAAPGISQYRVHARPAEPLAFDPSVPSERSYTVDKPGCQVQVIEPRWQNAQIAIEVAALVSYNGPLGRFSQPVLGSFDMQPISQIVATPAQGTTPLAVSLDAAGSTGGDAPIVNYDWFIGGQGQISGPDKKSISVSCGPGLTDISLTVTNSEGESSRTTRTIIGDGWLHTWKPHPGEDFDGSDSEIAASSTGAVYSLVRAYSSIDLENKAYLLKRSSSGNLEWVRSTAAFGYDAAIAVLPDESLWLVGVDWSSLPYRLKIASLSPDGDLNWARVISPLSGSLIQSVIDVLPVGNTVAIVWKKPTGNSALGVFDASGNAVWARSLSDSVFRCYEVSASAAGVTLLGGMEAGQPDGKAIIAIDSTGDLLWQRAVTTAWMRCQIAPDGSTLAFTVQDGSHVLSKLDGSGQTLWTKALEFSGGTFFASHLSVDANGSPFICGLNGATSSGSAVLQFASNGQFVRSLEFGLAEAMRMQVVNGHAYICGSTVEPGLAEADSVLVTTLPGTFTSTPAAYSLNSLTCTSETVGIELPLASGIEDPRDGKTLNGPDLEPFMLKLPL